MDDRRTSQSWTLFKWRACVEDPFSNAAADDDPSLIEIVGVDRRALLERGATDLAIPSEIDGKRIAEVVDWDVFSSDPHNRWVLNYEFLTSLTIPETVERFDPEFFECSFLTNLHEIKVAPENPFFKDVDGVLYSKSSDVLIAYPAGRKDERFVVPDGVEKIGDDAFGGCEHLKEVALPESVKEIDKYAFYACDALERVALSDGITTIGESAFECCENLESIVLPKGLTELGDYAFSYCLALKKIGVPKGVKTIGEGIFNNCEALESATLPAGLESIGEIAFAGCDVLANIKLPKGVKSLGEAAFLGCQALKSVDLPESLTQIGDEAFDAVPDDCAFRVVPGSYAEKWSRENHRRVESRKR